MDRAAAQHRVDRPRRVRGPGLPAGRDPEGGATRRDPERISVRILGSDRDAAGRDAAHRRRTGRYCGISVHHPRRDHVAARYRGHHRRVDDSGGPEPLQRAHPRWCRVLAVMKPVNVTPGTPYGVRGSYWSCDRDAHGNGIHTGVDYPAAVGTTVVAARPGQLVWCDHGSAFGTKQVEVRADAAAGGGRDFYAHMCYRAAAGRVAAGEKIGEVGMEGNTTGPHLHFERHTTTTGGWSCAVVTNPQPSIEWSDDEMTENDWQRLTKIVNTAVDRVWSEKMTVTQPGSGQDTEKAREQVLRETYQTVKRNG